MTASSIQIRRAKTQDCSAILKCLQGAFEPYRAEYTPDAFADTILDEQTIRTRMEGMSLFVAVDLAGSVVGTIGCGAIGNAEGHIRGMAVLPEWHGKGVAENLLRAAEEDLGARGCTRVTLDTTAPLKRAIRFYERNGYQATGKVEDFFGMPLFEYEKPL